MEELHTLLEQAAAAVREGNPEEAAGAVEALKKLPRTADGVFETAAGADGIYSAARLVYPVYAAYETACNKKEGYPDILSQIRVLDRKLAEEYTLGRAADYLKMLIDTIDCISPQIYECYRELVDLFRAGVKKALGSFDADGAFTGRNREAEAALRSALRRACETDVLLAEKYQAFC